MLFDKARRLYVLYHTSSWTMSLIEFRFCLLPGDVLSCSKRQILFRRSSGRLSGPSRASDFISYGLNTWI